MDSPGARAAASFVIVVDSSAVIALLLGKPGAGPVEIDSDRHAPEICELEVVSFLGKEIRARRLSVERAAEALADYLALRIRIHGHRALLPRCLTLASNFTAYDASYVALAERLRVPFVTLDFRLRRAVERHARAVALGF
jgi:predicted nucleic acid-binding protein